MMLFDLLRQDSFSQRYREQRERARAKYRRQGQRRQERLKTDPEFRERVRGYYAKYRKTERCYETQKAWRSSEHGKASAKRRQRSYHQRPEVKRAKAAYVRQRRMEKHPVQLRTDARYYNSEKRKEYTRRWQKTEKGRAVVCRNVKKRRALMESVFSDFTAKQWLALVRAYDGLCAYCGRSGHMTEDHLVPISSGGQDTLVNIVPCCRPCNTAKHNKPLDVMLARRGIDPVAFLAKHSDAVDKVRSIT